ncbi:S41 family peptidase [Chengkuizengella axinellae]|uniref:S41 family peptidase n=1 Tax=Chengkuizengella axinellae TaxID=3064388 RepID=A0ABT9J2S1_9BACL|nr:S41 family peptidase [Chengkuizengella sp. 2205SS18-9]MDP5275916.1 S41 family peptidase [Chengkuizengella sp. 2205SS18-9]
MVLKRSTVTILIILSMIIGAVLSITIVNWSTSIFAEQDETEQETMKEETKDTFGFTETDLKKMSTVFGIIGNDYYKEMDKTEIIDGAIRGMLASLDDPYTVYYDAEQSKMFREAVNSSITGIGAEVTMEDNRVTVVSPIKDSPAEQAGIRAKDQIISVNGESLEGLTLNDAVLKIRGPKGTQAKLEILRSGFNETIEIIVVRDQIDIETIQSEMLEGNIGYIEIKQFSQHTSDRFHEDLTQLESEGLQSLIIDVRNNPGGFLDTAIELLDPLLEEGKIIVQVEDRQGNRQETRSKQGGKPYSIVVLTNNGSASASEILAGAIRESADGIIVGENTFGKGTVQNTFPSGVNDGSELKVTIAKWLTPNGNFINEVGIEPDYIVEQPAFYTVAPLRKDEVLSLESVGENVKTLQIMLESLGFNPERSDGFFDVKTEAALKNFQAENGLSVTGKVDELTANEIEKQIIAKFNDPENDYQLQKAIKVLSGS